MLDTEQRSRGGLRIGRRVLHVLLGVGVLLILLVLVALPVVIVLKGRGYMPKREVFAEQELTAPARRLTSEILISDEELQYLFSRGVLSYREQGTICTNRRLIGYSSASGSMLITAFDFADMRSLLVDVVPPYSEGFRSVHVFARVELRSGERHEFLIGANDIPGTDRLAAQVTSNWRFANDLHPIPVSTSK